MGGPVARRCQSGSRCHTAGKVPAGCRARCCGGGREMYPPAHGRHQTFPSAMAKRQRPWALAAEAWATPTLPLLAVAYDGPNGQRRLLDAAGFVEFERTVLARPVPARIY